MIHAIATGGVVEALRQVDPDPVMLERLETPAQMPDDLLGDDEGPWHEVLRFCATYGASLDFISSLDFIYLGDVVPLIRGAARAMLGKEPRT